MPIPGFCENMPMGIHLECLAVTDLYVLGVLAICMWIWAMPREYVDHIGIKWMIGCILFWPVFLVMALLCHMVIAVDEQQECDSDDGSSLPRVQRAERLPRVL